MAGDVSVSGMRVPVPIVEAVLRMRADNPQLLDVFRRAAREAADAAAYEVVASPAETVHQAQGRARVWQAFAAVLAQPEQFATNLEAAKRRQ